jgi:nucleoside-diphosphate-sugar epimerase
MREFLYVDDMASASVFVMNLDRDVYQTNSDPMQSHINVGNGSDVSIGDLARIIANTLYYKGGITFDASRPDGSPRKFMDSSKLNKLGWRPNVGLEEGVKKAYGSYLAIWAQTV